MTALSYSSCTEVGNRTIHKHLITNILQNAQFQTYQRQSRLGTHRFITN